MGIAVSDELFSAGGRKGERGGKGGECICGEKSKVALDVLYPVKRLDGSMRRERGEVSVTFLSEWVPILVFHLRVKA